MKRLPQIIADGLKAGGIEMTLLNEKFVSVFKKVMLVIAGIFVATSLFIAVARLLVIGNLSLLDIANLLRNIGVASTLFFMSFFMSVSKVKNVFVLPAAMLLAVLCLIPALIIFIFIVEGSLFSIMMSALPLAYLTAMILCFFFLPINDIDLKKENEKTSI